jgi:hypothetical protein
MGFDPLSVFGDILEYSRLVGGGTVSAGGCNSCKTIISHVKQNFV